MTLPLVLFQVQVLTAPASTSDKNTQTKNEADSLSLMGAVPAKGAPGAQGPAGIFVYILYTYLYLYISRITF